MIDTITDGRAGGGSGPVQNLAVGLWCRLGEKSGALASCSHTEGVEGREALACLGIQLV